VICVLSAIARLSLGRTFHELGDYRSAMDLLHTNVAVLTGALARERFEQPFLISVYSRLWLAWCHAWRGDFAESAALAAECRVIAEDVDQPADLAMACVARGLPVLLQGDLEQAILELDRALTLARTRGLRGLVHPCSAFAGYAYGLAGRLDEGVALLEDALDLAASVKYVPCVSLWTGWLAEVNLLQGRTADATWHAERSLQLAVEHKEGAYQAFAHRILGDLATRRAPLEAASADEHFRRATSMAEERRMRPLIAHCHVGRSRLLQRLDKRREADEHLARATAMYREMGMRYWLERATARL
jgi:tetratricopeptide (TPR) repeat protein